MRAFPVIAVCGFLTMVTAQTGLGDPTDPAPPALVEIMHGAGAAPDTYISSRTASMGLDSFTIEFSQPARLVAATVLTNTPGAALDVIALVSQFDDHDDDTENRHPGVDSRGIEIPLGLGDHPSETTSGGQILADNRPYQRESHRGVQARNDPAHRRREKDMSRQLAPVGAKHPGVVDQVAIHIANTLIRIEEHDKEDQRKTQRDL